MANGIRSYGPGKFHTILDSHAYEMALDGVDEELSLGEGNGWYGLIQLGSDGAERVREIAKEQKDPLTRDEEAFLDGQAAVIFFERSDGIVEATWYNDELTARQDWEELESEFEDDDEEDDDDLEESDDEEDEEDEDEPEEDDDDVFSEEEMREGFVISDKRGGGYTVAHGGKHFGDYRDMNAKLFKDIAKQMKSDNFYGNIYYVNDHGNIDLLDSKGNIISSRV